MVPQIYKGLYRYVEGHDVDGLIYRVKISNKLNEEVSRTPTNKRLIWQHGTANLGVKAFKKTKPTSEYVRIYKQNAWNNSEMKDHIAKSALKAVKKPTAKKGKKNESNSKELHTPKDKS